MITRILSIIGTALLSACVSTAVQKPDTSPWKDFGYEGMAAKINRVAGATALNCGIRNYLSEDDPVNQYMSNDDSKQCIKSAIAAGQPFKYGTIRIPEDSFLFEAITLNEKKEFWLIRYDSMIDQSDSKHFIDRCKNIEINYSHLTYRGIDCQQITTSEWLSDIPEQQ